MKKSDLLLVVGALAVLALFWKLQRDLRSSPHAAGKAGCMNGWTDYQ